MIKQKVLAGKSYNRKDHYAQLADLYTEINTCGSYADTIEEKHVSFTVQKGRSSDEDERQCLKAYVEVHPEESYENYAKDENEATSQFKILTKKVYERDRPEARISLAEILTGRQEHNIKVKNGMIITEREFPGSGRWAALNLGVIDEHGVVKRHDFSQGIPGNIPMRNIPIVDIFALEAGTWIVLDTACNCTVMSENYYHHALDSYRLIKSPDGLPSPTPFRHTVRDAKFGGVGGPNAVRCLSECQMLVALMSVSGERMPMNSIQVSVTSGDIPLLGGIDYMRNSGIVLLPLANVCWRIIMIQDPDNKDGKIQVAYELPLYMTKGAHLPCIKIDHFIENCILDERLGKPSLAQLIAEGQKDHCISAHFDYKKRETFDNWFELNQSNTTPS